MRHSMFFVLSDPQRNLIDGQWHRIKENRWAYQDPVNHIVTFCGLEADDPPYKMNSIFEKAEPQCAACDYIAWQVDHDRLMAIKP